MFWDWLWGALEGLFGGAVEALPTSGLNLPHGALLGATLASAESWIPVRGPVAIVMSYVGAIGAWALFRVGVFVWKLVRG